jgi:hypothetical protein
MKHLERVEPLRAYGQFVRQNATRVKQTEDLLRNAILFLPSSIGGQYRDVLMEFMYAMTGFAGVLHDSLINRKTKRHGLFHGEGQETFQVFAVRSLLTLIRHAECFGEILVRRLGSEQLRWRFVSLLSFF